MAEFKLKRFFTFGGVSSADFSVYLSKEPVFPLGNRKVTSYEIPGRNGSLHIDEGCYEELPLELDLLLQGDAQTGNAITQWLNSGNGKPLPLKISSWPGITFMAIPETTGGLTWQLNSFHRGKLTMRLQPQKYHDTGLVPTRYAMPASGTKLQEFRIDNPGTETAAPVIRVDIAPGVTLADFRVTVLRSTASGAVTESGIKLVNVSGFIEIDMETGEARNDTGDMTSHVEYLMGAGVLNPFDNLLLRPGESRVRLFRYDGSSFGVDAITITGRWWDA